MREKQKVCLISCTRSLQIHTNLLYIQSNLTTQELHVVFEKYSVSVSDTSSTPASRHMTTETFASFLLSADNSPFTDNHAKITHAMSHPLSDYYISSSHNTYLVGHQLVGDSTIEGYIRALLHSCRSVECLLSFPSSCTRNTKLMFLFSGHL